MHNDRTRLIDRELKLLGIVVLLTWFIESGWSQQPGTVRWRVQIGAPTLQYPYWDVISSPAIAGDGTIYIGNGAQENTGTGVGLFSISPLGATNWVFRTGYDVRSSPAIAIDGTIYVASTDGNLYAVSRTGRTNWVFRAGGWICASPAVGADRKIYINTIYPYNFSLNRLYAINPDGTTNWSFYLGLAFPNHSLASTPAQFSSPAIGPDGTIYVGSLNSNIFALSPDGTSRWTFHLNNVTYGSVAVGRDGTLYCGCDDYKLYAITPYGTKKWEYLTGSTIESSPAVGPDGTVYFGSGDTHLYAVAATSASEWTASAGDYISSSPALAADGTIYCASLTSLSAYNAAGSNIWTFTPPANNFIFSSPAIGPDGTIYIAAGPYLYAIYGSAPLEHSSWPMFRRDLKHNSRSIQRSIGPPSFLADGSAAMTMNLETGLIYQVQASTDLANWTDLTNFVSGSLTSQFIDTSATNFPRRFYRMATQE